MANCSICGQEITQEDKNNGNFRQDLYGAIRHRECPNETLICAICGKPVEKSQNAGTKQWPRHPNCYLNLKPETETEAEPSSWIVRGRR